MATIANDLKAQQDSIEQKRSNLRLSTGLKWITRHEI